MQNPRLSKPHPLRNRPQRSPPIPPLGNHLPSRRQNRLPPLNPLRFPPTPPSLSHRSSVVASIVAQTDPERGAEISVAPTAGYWSRRITQEHRIVYKVVDDAVWIAKVGKHYE